jgi:hypothetical protein
VPREPERVKEAVVAATAADVWYSVGCVTLETGPCVLDRKASAIGEEVVDSIKVARNLLFRDNDCAVVERRGSAVPAANKKVAITKLF